MYLRKKHLILRMVNTAIIVLILLLGVTATFFTLCETIQYPYSSFPTEIFLYFFTLGLTSYSALFLHYFLLRNKAEKINTKLKWKKLLLFHYQALGVLIILFAFIKLTHLLQSIKEIPFESKYRPPLSFLLKFYLRRYYYVLPTLIYGILLIKDANRIK